MRLRIEAWRNAHWVGVVKKLAQHGATAGRVTGYFDIAVLFTFTLTSSLSLKLFAASPSVRNRCLPLCCPLCLLPSTLTDLS